MSSLEVRRQSELRASDADRDRCVQALQVHYAQGRIEDEELEQRLEEATRARTQGELYRLVRDLPGHVMLRRGAKRAKRAQAAAARRLPGRR